MDGFCLKQVVAMAVVILATGSTATDCSSSYPQACGAKFQGLDVEDGRVTDVVIAKCGVGPENRPQHHYIEAWIDYRSAGSEWVQVTNKGDSYSQVIPRKASRSRSVPPAGRVSTAVRTMWKVQGRRYHLIIPRGESSRSNTLIISGPRPIPWATAQRA